MFGAFPDPLRRSVNRASPHEMRGPLVRVAPVLSNRIIGYLPDPAGHKPFAGFVYLGDTDGYSRIP